jgi:hypothetical protein
MVAWPLGITGAENVNPRGVITWRFLRPLDSHRCGMLHSDTAFWLPVRLRENLCPLSSKTGPQLLLVAVHSVFGDPVHNEIVASCARSCAILVGHARRWKCMVIILALKAIWKNKFRIQFTSKTPTCREQHDCAMWRLRAIGKHFEKVH